MTDPSDASLQRSAMEPFYDWFDHGADRAIAITLPVLLETLLEEALRINLRPDKGIAAEFFRPSGPLGNFGAKARMAYMMDIIKPELYKDLLIITKIRNEFAHKLEIKTFDDPVIRQWVKSLSAYKMLNDFANSPIRDDEPDYTFSVALKNSLIITLSTELGIFRECVRMYVNHIRTTMDIIKPRGSKDSGDTP